MKPSAEQIGDLLALKRHERPPEGYMEDFLHEFHQRRRMEASVERGFSGWWKRLNAWWSEAGTAKWAYGAGLAYATVLMTMLVLPRHAQDELPALQPVNHQIVEPAQVPAGMVEQLEELDLRATSEGKTGEQEF